MIFRKNTVSLFLLDKKLFGFKISDGFFTTKNSNFRF